MLLYLGWSKIMTDNEKLLIPSPLGDFQVLLEHEGGEVEQLKYGETTLGDFEIETSLKETYPQLIDEMKVSHTYLLDIKIKAQESLKSFRVICVCIDSSKFKKGGPSSGEWFDAQTWNNKTHMITLGTQDGDYLASCAEDGKQIPCRFREHINELGCLDWIEYLKYGISINVPNLKEKEFVSFKFSLSWKSGSDDEDDSTWFAASYSLG